MNNLKNLNGEQKEKMIPFTLIGGLVILFIIFCITLLSLTFKGEYVLHYSESSNLDYKVYLKESAWDLYNGKKYLNKGNVYISSAIDYIDSDFYYTFKSDDNLDLNYTYYITANIDYQNADGGDFGADYEETLVKSNTYKKSDDNTFKISENLKLDYNKYNQIATNFISSTGITANATLTVKLYVDVVGNHAEFDKDISDKAAIVLTVPLVNSTMQIQMDYDLSNNYDQTLQYRSAIINNPFIFVTCIVLAVLDLIAMAIIIAYIIITRDDATLYKKKLNKILKDYDKYISETFITENVEELMKTKSLRIEVVKTFEGLIDIRDNLNVPILYHEEIPGKEAVFYIITDRIGYIYVMRKEDMKKKDIAFEIDTKKSKKVSKNKNEVNVEKVTEVLDTKNIKNEAKNEMPFIVEKIDNNIQNEEVPIVELNDEKIFSTEEINVNELNDEFITEEDISSIEQMLAETNTSLFTEEELNEIKNANIVKDDDLNDKIEIVNNDENDNKDGSNEIDLTKLDDILNDSNIEVVTEEYVVDEVDEEARKRRLKKKQNQRYYKGRR